MDKNDDTGELSLSPAWKRACISAVALVAGVSIGGGILHFISRSVARMQVIDGGKMVKLETYRMSGRGLKSRVVPIGDMFSRDRLFTGEGPLGVSRGKSPQYSIYANRSSSYAYIMSRSGWFMNPKLFDVLFHRAVVSGD
ncbi:hypothetical protein GGI02_006004 [Coemansia sp. RSA 2322]|nr:hypothetical protein GGI02_006004 [Coemansia sp. RSA 2322]KAJ2467198.1 hypothetical protein EV174_006436 [Coemansia sp. RSA 2320]